MMEHDATTPPLDIQAYPVHITLRISRNKLHYNLEIYALDTMFTVPIEMSSHDLAALNKEFHRVAESIISKNVEDGHPTGEKLGEPLLSLAEEGYYAFRKVFRHASTLTLLQDILRSRTRISMLIVSEDFFLPWELFYPVSPDDPLSYENFWGVNHIISRVFAQKDLPGTLAEPAIHIISLPRIGLMTYKELPTVGEKEIPFFDRLHRDGKIHLFKLRELDPNKKQEGFREFKVFWANELHLAHLACHAFYEEEAPHESYILLSNEFPISLRDMEIYLVDDEHNPLIIQNYPLIIVNACETGNLNPLYTSSFAREFLKHGARGVVATECAIPDVFAADFAENLYDNLLAGKPLGESLLTTRQYFLKRCQNPIGLLYSMYARPSIRLAYDHNQENTMAQT